MPATSAAGLWKSLLAGVLDALYPPRCVVAGCGRPGAWLCPSCAAGIRLVPEPRCALCGDAIERPGLCPGCRRDAPPFAWACAVGVYEPPLRDAVHALKYQGRQALAPLLGARLAAVLPDLAGDAWIVPIPAHPARTRSRGVDHTRRLAEATAVALGLECRVDGLTRTRDTRPQVGLDPAARRANVAAAFAARPDVTGRLVVLVDDVMTTGATARSAAAALLGAGARQVVVGTVARAIGRGAWGLA